MKKSAWALLFSFSFAHAAQDEGVSSRVYAHALLGDYTSAIEEAKAAVARDESSPQLWETYIGALAAGEKREPMLRAWERYAALQPGCCDNRQLLEKMAWSEISAAYRSPSPVVRVTALLAASFGDDARGVDLLCQGLRDSNSFIRGVTLQIIGRFRDSKLCDAVVSLYGRERIAAVRWQAVRALGQMKVHRMKAQFLALLADEKTEAEGKAAAIEALVSMEENASHEELLLLAESPRAGLRELACEVVSSFDLEEELPLMVPLLKDPQPGVRAAALRTLGFLRAERVGDFKVADLMAPLVQDPDRQVAITAAWAATLANPAEGQQLFRKWLAHPREEVKLAAAAALAATGKYGYPLVIEAFDESRDPYLQLTLACGMISQRQQVEKASAAIRRWLAQNHERWMWQENGPFRAIAPSTVKHNAAIPHYPEAVSQMVRLELLNTLAIVGDPDVQNSLQAFLSEPGWGVSSTASALLLTEGDESAVEVVEKLLEDGSPSIRTQAALILALWGRGEASLQQLQNAYNGASREFKERILEGVGRVGLSASIPFLVEKLGEPYPTLRIIAAAALLQCLYH